MIYQLNPVRIILIIILIKYFSKIKINLFSETKWNLESAACNYSVVHI